MDLQNKAEKIADKLNLPQGLRSIGEAYLVGNVALKTTIKPDIDIQIYSLPSNWESNSRKVITYFADLGLIDFISRELKESNKHLLSFSYVENNLRWTIDITQTTKSSDYLSDAYCFYLDYHQRFTPEKIEIIKNLKSYFLNQGMLHKSMSFFIYQAVIDENAITVDDIYKYLDKINIKTKRFKQ